MTTFRNSLFLLAVLISTPGLTGCAGKNKTPEPVVFYTLDYEAPAPEANEPLPICLSVDTFKVSAPYDSNRIIYSTDAHIQGRYYYHQWITTPAEMVTRLLMRDFIASRRFQAVIDTREGWATHHLEVTIDKFYEEDGPDAWFGVISVTAVLLDYRGNKGAPRICFQKTYHRRLPCARKNPKSLVLSLSLALSEISKDLMADTHDAIRRALRDLDD